jgi:neurotransmitter:Na+ symporter, NSS family
MSDEMVVAGALGAPEIGTKRLREHWGTRLGFLMAAAGSAIGLGLLWKLPYVTGKQGGGLFLLLYVVALIVVGVPVYIAELMLGRSAQRAAVGIFAQICPKRPIWRIAGWLGVISSFVILSYYSVVAGWGLNYLTMSFAGAFKGRGDLEGLFASLSGSPTISLFWHLVFMLLTIGVVYGGVRAGIEYWSRIMTGGLLLLLVVLFGYALTLDGFGQAVSFVFTPDWSQITPTTCLEALGLALMTLSVGQGILLTYGSYAQKRDNLPRMACLVAGMVLVVAVLASLMIFPVVFTFGMQPQQGEGLVFATLPMLFGKLAGGSLLAIAFFVLFVFTALTSAVALLEVVVANCTDLYGWSRKKAVWLLGGAIFVAGIPSAFGDSPLFFGSWSTLYGKTFFQTMDHLAAQWLLPVDALLIALFVGWIAPKQLLKDEFGGPRPLFTLWRIVMRYIVPAAILIIIFQRGGLIDLDAIISPAQNKV